MGQWALWTLSVALAGMIMSAAHAEGMFLQSGINAAGTASLNSALGAYAHRPGQTEPPPADPAGAMGNRPLSPGAHMPDGDAVPHGQRTYPTQTRVNEIWRQLEPEYQQRVRLYGEASARHWLFDTAREIGRQDAIRAKAGE